MYLPIPLLLVLLTPFGMAQDDENHPWTVFTATAPIRSEPCSEADVINHLERGDTVSGHILVDQETSEEFLVTEHEDHPASVSLNSVHRVHPSNVGDDDLTIGEEFVNRWWGLPLEYVPSDLTDIPLRFVINDSRHPQLRRAAKEALVRMLEAARDDDIDIQVISAHRGSDYQRERLADATLRHGPGQRVVARPGHSEHQLGTTVDLSDPAAEYATEPEFAHTPQGLWLAEHAGEFGFVQSYTEHNVPETGYNPESWHFRYMGESPASSAD